MLKEFKDFIMTGNVIEFAVAVILAGAVGTVVNGFVSDIIMPIVGHFTGGVSFSDLAYELSAQVGVEGAADFKPANKIMWGAWADKIFSLITVGLVLFFIVKAYNKAKAPVEAPAPAGPSDNDLLSEIRDLLKK